MPLYETTMNDHSCCVLLLAHYAAVNYEVSMLGTEKKRAERGRGSKWEVFLAFTIPLERSSRPPNNEDLANLRASLIYQARYFNWSHVAM